MERKEGDGRYHMREVVEVSMRPSTKKTRIRQRRCKFSGVRSRAECSCYSTRAEGFSSGMKEERNTDDGGRAGGDWGISRVIQKEAHGAEFRCKGVGRERITTLTRAELKQGLNADRTRK